MHMGGTSFASLPPHVHRTRVVAGHAEWAEVGGSVIFVTYGEVVHWYAQMSASYFLVSGSDSIGEMPYMLASAGQPSLHGC